MGSQRVGHYWATFTFTSATNWTAAATAAKSRQSCPTLCDPMDSSPPGSHPWDSPGKNTGVGCHFLLQCMKGKSESEVAQLSPTLCDPTDCSLPGSPVHGILQARVLEWGAIAFSHAEPSNAQLWHFLFFFLTKSLAFPGVNNYLFFYLLSSYM